MEVLGLNIVVAFARGMAEPNAQRDKAGNAGALVLYAL